MVVIVVFLAADSWETNIHYIPRALLCNLAVLICCSPTVK
jgi:hypothetical protein